MTSNDEDTRTPVLILRNRASGVSKDEWHHQGLMVLKAMPTGRANARLRHIALNSSVQLAS
jgi:hypothetical protein